MSRADIDAEVARVRALAGKVFDDGMAHGRAAAAKELREAKALIGELLAATAPTGAAVGDYIALQRVRTKAREWLRATGGQ